MRWRIFHNAPFRAWPRRTFCDHRRLRFLRVRPRRLECVLEFHRAELGQGGRGPTVPAPGVRYRRKGVRCHHALELLFVGRELEIRGATIGSESDVDARDLERRSVKVRPLGRPLERQRHAAQIGAGCHRPRNLLILAGVRGTISHFCCARSTRSPLAVGRNPDACCRQLFVGPATPGLFSVCDADLNALTRRRLPCYGFACLIHVPTR